MQKPLLRSDKEITALYEAHFQSVWNLSYTLLRNRADTEDCVQETFLRLVDKGPFFESEEHAKGWLLLTCKNIARSKLSHWWRKREDPEDIEEPGEEDPEPDEILPMLLSLPTDDRTVLYLYYYEGYSTVEIAALLKTKEATIRTRMRRAREKLKNKLGGLQL